MIFLNQRCGTHCKRSNLSPRPADGVIVRHRIQQQIICAGAIKRRCRFHNMPPGVAVIGALIDVTPVSEVYPKFQTSRMLFRYQKSHSKCHVGLFIYNNRQIERKPIKHLCSGSRGFTN